MNKTLRQSLAGLTLLGLLATTLAWQQQPLQPLTPLQSLNDTVPNRKAVRDLDEALVELERGEAELERARRSTDFRKMEAELEAARKELAASRVQMKEEMEKALKSIDVQAIQEEVNKAMKELNSEAVRSSMRKELGEASAEKIRAQVEASLAKVDMARVRAELEKVEKVDLSKLEAELSTIRPQVEKSMQEARASLETARKELTVYKTLVDGLHADGLINKNGNYTIEYRAGKLQVNGKEQPAAAKKYDHLLKEKKDFRITRGEDEFNIRNLQ
jgi:multidrug efflux pump subunit AcrA (membrane-fusion protein)